MNCNIHNSIQAEMIEVFSQLNPVDQQKTLNYMRALGQKDNTQTWERYHDLIWRQEGRCEKK